jgi:GDSL-like Lipase/Acylhydrolase family
MSEKKVALIGDSIFDNKAYAGEKKSTIEHLQERCPAVLLAVDGSITAQVIQQLDSLPKDVTHIVVSSGGNDALIAKNFTDSSPNHLETLAVIQKEFRINYGRLLKLCLKTGRDVVACTIYDSIPILSETDKTALSIFNDVIVSQASSQRIPVIDLRSLCIEPDDYSELSPIEPSTKGSAKIAKKIACVIAEHNFKLGSVIYGL